MKMTHSSALIVSGLMLLGTTLSATAAGPALIWKPIGVKAVAIPLDDKHPLHFVGDFKFVGGLELTSPDSDQMHELSDIEVNASGKLIAVGDSGVLFEAQLLLDKAGQLTGMNQARIATLTGLDGLPLKAKEDMDAEGLTLMPNGDRLISFERHDRIWLYPANDGPPRAVPAPAVTFPVNVGMKALGADPERARDAYLVGAEGTGETWHCRLSATACTQGPTVAKPKEYSLVALKRLPKDRTVWLLRAYDPKTNTTSISLQLWQGTKLLTGLEMTQPLTIDNFEGVAVVKLPKGGLRFYLMSDDNNKPDERTLLMAFDWFPQG